MLHGICSGGAVGLAVSLALKAMVLWPRLVVLDRVPRGLKGMRQVLWSTESSVWCCGVAWWHRRWACEHAGRCSRSSSPEGTCCLVQSIF
jgi:hypothetical protein